MSYIFVALLLAITTASSETRQLGIFPLEPVQDCKGPNEVRTNCGSACPHRCSKIGLPAGPCPHVCINNICECKRGFFRDDITGECVLPGYCTLRGIQTIDVVIKNNDKTTDDNLVKI